MIGQRISGWLELSFWQLVVRSLTLARVFTREAVVRTQQARQSKLVKSVPPIRVAPTFSFQLATAVAGWGLGLALGYLIARGLF